MSSLFLLTRLLLLLVLQMSLPVAHAAPPAIPAELQPLLDALRRARYRVIFEKPPLQGAYGLTDTRKRHIWIAPISIELGIMRATLIHEAVHAAQGCPKGRLKPIGWSIDLEHKIEREISGLLYMNYRTVSFEVEREAFSMQSHPRAIPMLIAALDQRCR